MRIKRGRLRRDLIRIVGDRAVEVMSFTVLSKIGDGTRIKVIGYEEGKIMRGHIKLFMLQMNLERSWLPKNAAMTENVGFVSCRDAASSMQRIFLPSLKIISCR